MHVRDQAARHFSLHLIEAMLPASASCWRLELRLRSVKACVPASLCVMSQHVSACALHIHKTNNPTSLTSHASLLFCRWAT